MLTSNRGLNSHSENLERIPTRQSSLNAHKKTRKFHKRHYIIEVTTEPSTVHAQVLIASWWTKSQTMVHALHKSWLVILAYHAVVIIQKQPHEQSSSMIYRSHKNSQNSSCRTAKAASITDSQRQLREDRAKIHELVLQLRSPDDMPMDQQFLQIPYQSLSTITGHIQGKKE